MCEGLTKAGGQCRRKGSPTYCHQHGPVEPEISTNLGAIALLLDGVTPATAMLARTLAAELDRQMVTGGLNANLVQRYMELIEALNDDSNADTPTVGDMLAELLNPSHAGST